MSWLEELNYDHEYQCPSDHVSVIKLTPNLAVPESIGCAYCGAESRHIGFRPQKMGGQLRVEFEKNGRIGYAITTGSETTYISKTKLEYMKTGQNKSHFSREYEQHTADKMQNEFGKFQKTLDSNATVSGASKKETANEI